MWSALSAMVVSSSLVFVFGATFAERDADGVAVLVAHAVDGVIIEVFGAATPIAFEFISHRSYPPDLPLAFHLPGLGDYHRVVDCPAEIFGVRVEMTQADLAVRPVAAPGAPPYLVLEHFLAGFVLLPVILGLMDLDRVRPEPAGPDEGAAYSILPRLDP